MPFTSPPLQALGERLRSERLRRNEPQVIFAARIGISRPTLKKMESGDPSIQIGKWVMALDILDRTEDIDLLLAPKEDLFAKYDKMNVPARIRASRMRE